ncbi:MAG: histidine kinase [Bacteroidota bacterium]
MAVAVESDQSLGKSLQERLGEFLSRRPVYHTIGWIAFYALSVYLHISVDDTSLSNGLLPQGINLIFYMVVVYFNLYYLFPNYLSKNRYLVYLLFLILTCVLVTLLELMTKFLVFNQEEQLLSQLGALSYTHFFDTFLVAGLSTVGRIMTDWFRVNRERQELQTQTMQSELRFLKSQINPHFLFNTLNSLYALTLKKSEQAPEIVIKLSEMMRYMLYECNEKQVPLRKEINYLRNYLDLERLRQRDDIDIQLTVEGPVGEQQIAPLMFIPFVENSFKHGLNSGINEGFVHIKLKVARQEVEFAIENSKSSLLPKAPNPNRPSGGIGLVNVRRRLELLYPNANALEIDETPNTYQAKLRLQL